MALPPIVLRVVSKLGRSEIVGVNAHTLAIAMTRAERDQIDFDQLGERQIAVALLERVGYPENSTEFTRFMSVGGAFTPATLSDKEITDQHAPPYLRWVAAFLNDPEPTVHKNARYLLRWLVVNRAAAISTDQSSLDNLRRIADTSDSGWRSSAFIVYALGICGTLEADYDRVIRHSEQTIEHDRENIELVAEALYRMYPPALINALQYFLEHTNATSKQFMAGIHLLAKVAEIDDQGFWNTYYDAMDKIVEKLAEPAAHIPAVERIVDLIEKHLALASPDEE